MAVESRGWQPEWAIAPGELLLDILEDRGLSQSDLARRMGRPIKTINEIVNGKAAITPDTAIQLELALGVAAGFWNNAETAYRAHLARQRAEQQLAHHQQWAEQFPVKDLIRCGLVDKTSTQAATVAALLRYFGVSSPEAWQNQWAAAAVSFRASRAYESSPHAVAAWLRWGELLAARIDTRQYNARQLRSVMQDIRPLTRREIAVTRERIERLLASAGVALVMTPELSNVHLSGAARWLRNDKALIQLSLRYKSDDQLWFSLYHEAGHLLTGRREDFIDDENDTREARSDEEQAADDFARNTLIPLAEYERFVARGDFDRPTIRDIAKHLEIAPGILVGRLQRDQYLAPSALNDLKKSLRFGKV
jgi:HTH-type transcriptional regulator / antitoxin HigA